VTTVRPAVYCAIHNAEHRPCDPGRSDETPHARHLREMQETRPAEPPADIAAIPCRALTGEELIAARAWEAEWRRDRELRATYPDPTRRHLAEMRASRKEQP